MIGILIYKTGVPAYVRATANDKQKLKDLLDINHLGESPNPWTGKCEGEWFYVPWKALDFDRQTLALKLFKKV